MRTAQGFLRGVRSGAPSPSRGLWALLETLAGEDGARACNEVRSSAAMIHPFNQAYLQYAQAVIAGREGRQHEAEHALALGDELLAESCPWGGAYTSATGWLPRKPSHITGVPPPSGLPWRPASWTSTAGDAWPPLADRCCVKPALVSRAGRAHPGVPPSLRARRVTDREMEVLSLVADGLSNQAIGGRLYLSPKTVEKHISSLMDKLDVRSRAQLTAIAVSGGSSISRDGH